MQDGALACQHLKGEQEEGSKNKSLQKAIRGDGRLGAQVANQMFGQDFLIGICS